jgi:hypothetical protein
MYTYIYNITIDLHITMDNYVYNYRSIMIYILSIYNFRELEKQLPRGLPTVFAIETLYKDL